MYLTGRWERIEDKIAEGWIFTDEPDNSLAGRILVYKKLK